MAKLGAEDGLLPWRAEVEKGESGVNASVRQLRQRKTLPSQFWAIDSTCYGERNAKFMIIDTRNVEVAS